MTNTLFQLQSINNNRKDATLTEPDFSLDRAKTTLFLYMPGVTPGTFLFLVFGTTAGCRTALKAIFVSQPRRTTSIRPGRPFGRPWTKVESSKKAPQDPFVDSSRSILSTNRVSAPAFPATALVSKYNKSPHSRNDQPRAQATHQTHLYSWSRKYSNAEEMIMGEETAMELQGLTSTQRTHENYYQPSPEQSDDSGPVLLIMSTQDKRRSPGKTELAVSPSS